MTDKLPETAHATTPLQERAAQAAHEVNRAYCAFLGDHSQLPWPEAPEWQRDSARKGVQGVLDGNNPGDSHGGWLADKEADGWVYGERKDEQAKTHPCMVPFEALPPEQQLKDHLFVATVRIVLDMDQPEYPWPENVMQNSWTFRTFLLDIYKALAPVLGYEVNSRAAALEHGGVSVREVLNILHTFWLSGTVTRRQADDIIRTAYCIVAPLVRDDSKKTPESAVVTGDGPGAARLGDAVASAPAVQYISTAPQAPTVEPRFDTEGQSTGQTLTVPVDVPEGVDVTEYLEVVARDLRHRAGEHYRHRLGQGPAPTTELSDSGAALASGHGIWPLPERKLVQVLKAQHMGRTHYERVRSVLFGSEVEATFDEAEAPAEVKPADIFYLLDTNIPETIPVRVVPTLLPEWVEIGILPPGPLDMLPQRERLDGIRHTAQLDWVPERGRWEKVVSMEGKAVLLVCFAGPPATNVQ